MTGMPTDRPVGRPTKYRDEYCEEIIEDGRAGYSITGFAGKIGVARSQIVEWAAKYPEFQIAISIAKAERARNLEAHAQRMVSETCTGGQAGLIQFLMKNVAADEYRDRQEVTGADGKDLVPEHADPARLAAAVLDILKAARAERKRE